MRCATRGRPRRCPTRAARARLQSLQARRAAPGASPYCAADSRFRPVSLPANARPRHRCSGADVPCALRRCGSRQGASVLQRGPDAGWARQHVFSVAADQRPRRHRLARQHRSVGATARASTPSRRTQATSMVVVLPGGARFVSGSEHGTVKLWTIDGTLERTSMGSLVTRGAALPDGVHFVVGLAGGLGNSDSGCITSTGRSSTPSGAHRLGWSVAVTRDGQHIISGADDNLVKLWSVATKSLSTCRGHSGWVLTVAATRRPAHPQRRSTRPSACGASTAPSRHVQAAHRLVSAVVALPDNQHALSAGTTRPSSSSTSTTAPSCAPSSSTQRPVYCLTLLPTAAASSAARRLTARIAYHGLAAVNVGTPLPAVRYTFRAKAYCSLD